MIEWIEQAVVLAIHDRLIAEHGGFRGLRDPGTLESSLMRPQMLAAYGDPDMAALAASYAFGIAAKQAFIDGNKRTSSVVSRTFLNLNGYDYVASADEAIRLKIWRSIGAGSMSEETLVEWMRANIERVPD
jgi:death on curing protein